MAFSFRSVLPSEFDQACSLMNRTYARKKDISYFSWMYGEEQPTASLYGAFIDYKLIGIAGVRHRPLVCGATASVLSDIIVEQAYRGSGVFSSMLEQILSLPNSDLICAFTNHDGKNACVRAGKFRVITQIDALVSSPTLRQKMFIPQEGYILPGTFHVDSAFLQWRFLDSPLYRYKKEEEPPGFCYTKLFTDPVTKQSFGDIVYDDKLSAELYTSVVSSFQKHDVEEITTWALPHTHRYRQYASQGWITRTQQRFLCALVQSPQYEYLYESTNWDVFQCDSEVY